jgi:hypothetical protein
VCGQNATAGIPGTRHPSLPRLQLMKDTVMHIKTIIVTSLVLAASSLAFANQAPADAVYQWTDSAGTVHYTDDPGGAPKGKAKAISKGSDAATLSDGEIRGSKEEVQPRKLLRSLKKRAASESKADETIAPALAGPVSRPAYDPTLEVELRAVWRGYLGALSRNDAVAAAGFISHEERYYCVGIFKDFGKNLQTLAEGGVEIRLKEADAFKARCVAIREEAVKGRMVKVGYNIYFLRQDGVWKLQNCK